MNLQTLTGIVRAVSPNNGFLAVETRTGEFTIIEPLGGMAAVGDVIVGALESLGRETITNRTQEERFEVFIQDCHCSVERARQLL